MRVPTRLGTNADKAYSRLDQSSRYQHCTGKFWMIADSSTACRQFIGLQNARCLQLNVQGTADLVRSEYVQRLLMETIQLFRQTRMVHGCKRAVQLPVQSLPFIQLSYCKAFRKRYSLQ